MSKRNDIVNGVEYTVLLKNALGPDGISNAQNVFPSFVFLQYSGTGRPAHSHAKPNCFIPFLTEKYDINLVLELS